MLIRREVLAAQWRISYLERGTRHPGRPSLVLLHGLMGSAATFVPVLQALSPSQHALAIDLPGAGQSERNPRLGADLSSTSRCVEEILHGLQLTGPVLVGYSHGGAVGLHLAASQPGLLGSLVLLAPAHPYFRHADQVIRFYLSPLGAVLAHTLPWYPVWIQMIGLRRMAGPGNDDTPDRLLPYRQNLRTRGTIRHLLRLLGTWHSDMKELQQLLQAPFRLPTLLLWGDHDAAVPVSTAADLLKRLRQSEFHILHGVGHRPAEEEPEECARLIEDWIQRLPKRGRKKPIRAAD